MIKLFSLLALVFVVSCASYHPKPGDETVAQGQVNHTQNRM